MSKNIRHRRTWGKWKLYSTNPASLRIDAFNNHLIYHVPLRELEEEWSRKNWLKHIEVEKVEKYDQVNFRLAVEELLKDGTIKRRD